MNNSSLYTPKIASGSYSFKNEFIDDVIGVAIEKSNAGIELALITLISVEGSAPRKLGSQMLVQEDGTYFGYISGGCVESNLALIAQEVIKKQKPCVLKLGDGGDFFDIVLPCGSSIDVLIEPFIAKKKSTRRLIAAWKKRERVVWQTNLQEKQVCCEPISAGNVAGFDSGMYFWHYIPQVRLLLYGSDPVTLALAMLSDSMGWDVVLNGRQENKLCLDNFKGRYENCDALQFLLKYKPDTMTAVVSLCHDCDQDHELLKRVLPSEAFYVGVLGSRHHLHKRYALLDADNVDFKRLSGPVGLDIGADTPYEIAVSILAEIIQNKPA